MAIDIDRFTYEELIDLNNRIVERLKFLDQMRTHQEMLRLRIGNRVTFTPSGHLPVTGIIAMYNRKTVTIVTEDGQRFAGLSRVRLGGARSGLGCGHRRFDSAPQTAEGRRLSKERDNGASDG